MLEYIKNPLVLGIIAGLIAVLLTYLDTKLSDKQREKQVYIKIFLTTFGLIVGFMYISANYLNGDQTILQTQTSGVSMKGGTSHMSQQVYDKTVKTVADDIMRKMPLDLPNF